MDPQDIKENQELESNYRRVRFTAIVLAISTLVLCFLWGKTFFEPVDLAVARPASTEEHRVLGSSMLLHSEFGKLQLLDETALNISNSGDSALQEAINRSIEEKEAEFRKSIDSIEKETSKINAWANVVMIDSVTNSFKRALNNRAMMENFREAVNKQALALPDEQKQLLQLQFDINQKDQRIFDLQRQMASYSETRAPITREASSAKLSGDAAAELKDEEMRNAGLLDVINGLKEDNKKAQDELKKIRGSVAYNQSAYNTSSNKNSVLQEQVAQLTSDLNFAKINCNLVRADANKIISTPKQRKELLSEALQSLQELTLSENISVQQKAKEKIRELNAIASTVRD
ncbi:MAG: hypothetical protein ABI415_03425 [Flavitalea sp.]